jgi:hypothetical protein
MKARRHYSPEFDASGVSRIISISDPAYARCYGIQY